MQQTNKTLIIIPARYESSRFPGKPLYKIAGKTMLQHVCTTAMRVAQRYPGVDVLVATDDERIYTHAHEIGVTAVITPKTCQSGTDRIIAAISELPVTPNAIINLQGDTPLTPEIILQAMLEKLHTAQAELVITPVVQLTWSQLDILRQSKITNPFSGTTAIVNEQNKALWFSKQIIPAIRTEKQLRTNSELSPILQHIGIYGYTLDMLQTFSTLPLGKYEELEGLEQLRFIENGYTISTVQVQIPDLNAWRGVDTKEDAKFVESILLKSNPS
jgi:3-deoxy-manno-octulosonate cytidylyltransferase (CMP-KDO synthetase)